MDRIALHDVVDLVLAVRPERQASEKGALEECLQLGADEVLTKPLDMTTVLSRLRRGLARLQSTDPWG